MKQEENQNIEFKESWRDEYVKWICGFANANGGKLYIGINDKGIVKGIPDAKKLAEEIPNKTKDLLGIIVDVNIKKKVSQSYLEIIVEQYPFPISYKGQYHYRTGSTKQELKGAALDKFILRKQGKHWDSVPMPKLHLNDLQKLEVENFKKIATNALRLNAIILKENNTTLLQNLNLFDGKYLNRAAVLLFHPHPHNLITGAYIKIGFFHTDDDLQFQDEVFGTLYEQVTKTMSLLLTKYLKANITYKGINRIERYPFPELALREALLNAVAHKDYSTGNPIQISVYSNKIMIYNDGQLAENWTIQKLFAKHPSAPYNPLISRVFFLYGLIEAWGRGISKMIKECKDYGVAAPILNTDFNGFFIEFNDTNRDTNDGTNRDTNDGTSRDTNDGTNSGTIDENLLEKEIVLLLKKDNSISINDIIFTTKKSRRTILRYLAKLKSEGYIVRVGNNKVGHWKLTKKGK